MMGCTGPGSWMHVVQTDSDEKPRGGSTLCPRTPVPKARGSNWTQYTWTPQSCCTLRARWAVDIPLPSPRLEPSFGAWALLHALLSLQLRTPLHAEHLESSLMLYSQSRSKNFWSKNCPSAELLSSEVKELLHKIHALLRALHRGEKNYQGLLVPQWPCAWPPPAFRAALHPVHIKSCMYIGVRHYVRANSSQGGWAMPELAVQDPDVVNWLPCLVSHLPIFLLFHHYYKKLVDC